MAIFLGPSNRRILNQVVHLVVIRIVKWSDAYNHFIYQNAESPPIYCEVVTGPNYDFWRQILGSSTKRVGFFAEVLHYFSHSKVSQLNVTINIYQNVFRF